MKRALLAGVVILAWASAHTTAHAADITYRPCGPNPACRAIFITGEIEQGDDIKFADAVRNSGYKEALIVLNSPGGNGPAGLNIAFIIKEKGYYTHAENRCNSICTAIWLAGSVRQFRQGTELGFHSAGEYDDNDDLVKSDYGNNELQKYYAEIGIGTITGLELTAAPPDKVWMYSAERLRQLGIELRVAIDNWHYDREYP